jgi:hypothetical protein
LVGILLARNRLAAEPPSKPNEIGHPFSNKRNARTAAGNEVTSHPAPASLIECL